MTPDEYDVLRALFERACDLPEKEQSVLLARVRAESPALEHELRGLLDSDRRPLPIDAVLLRLSAPLRERLELPDARFLS